MGSNGYADEMSHCFPMQRNRTSPTEAQQPLPSMYLRSIITTVLFCFEQNSSASRSEADNNFRIVSEPQIIVVLFAATYSPPPTSTGPNVVPISVINDVQLFSMTAIQQTKGAMDFVIPLIQFLLCEHTNPVQCGLGGKLE
jgi:hypothetical protein